MRGLVESSLCGLSWTWCSPSIGPRFSTCWNSVCCSRTVVGKWMELGLSVVHRSPILPVGGWSWDKWSGKQLDLLVVVQDVLNVVERPSEE